MTNVVFASVVVSTKTSSFSLNLSYKGKEKKVETPIEGATQYTLAIEGVKTLASLLKPEFNYDVTLNRKEFVGYFKKWNSKPTGVNKHLVGELFSILKEKGWEYDEISSDDTSVVLYHTQTENLVVLHPSDVEPIWETEVSTEKTVETTTEVAEEVATQEEETEMKEEIKVTQPAKKVGNLTSETAKLLAGDFKWLNLKAGKSFTASEWSVYGGLSEISNKLIHSKGMSLNKVRVLKREAIEVEKKELTPLFPKGVEGEVALLLCGKDSSIVLENTVINNRDIFVGSVDSFKFSKMSLPNTTYVVLFWSEEEVPVMEPALDFTKVVSKPEGNKIPEAVVDPKTWVNPVKTLTVKGVDSSKVVTTTVFSENGVYCTTDGKIGEDLGWLLGLTIKSVKEGEEEVEYTSGGFNCFKNTILIPVTDGLCEDVVSLIKTKTGYVGEHDHRIYSSIILTIEANYGPQWRVLEKSSHNPVENSKTEVKEVFEEVEVILEDDITPHVPVKTSEVVTNLETKYKEMVEFQIMGCDVVTLTKDLFAFDSKMQRIFRAAGVDSVEINISKEKDEISNWISMNDPMEEKEIFLSYAHHICTGHLVGYRLCVAMSIASGLLTQEEVVDLLSN